MEQEPLVATLRLDVDHPGIVRIGAGPEGFRGIARVTGGRIDGDRLSADVVGGEDWFVIRPDGSVGIDVRATLRDAGGVSLALTYQGSLTGSPEALGSFARGKAMAPGSYVLATKARIGSGDPKYAWLDALSLDGVGEQIPGGVIYRFRASAGVAA